MLHPTDAVSPYTPVTDMKHAVYGSASYSSNLPPIQLGIGDALMLHQSQASQFHIGLRVTRKGPAADTPRNPTGFGSILEPQPTGAQSARLM